MEISLFHHLLFFSRLPGIKNNSCLIIIDYNNNMNSFFVYYLVRLNGITNDKFVLAYAYF